MGRHAGLGKVVCTGMQQHFGDFSNNSDQIFLCWRATQGFMETYGEPGADTSVECNITSQRWIFKTDNFYNDGCKCGPIDKQQNKLSSHHWHYVTTV